MAAKRPFDLTDVFLLVVVLGIAAAARVGYMLQFADGGAAPGPLAVQDASPLLDLPSQAEMPRHEQDALVHNLEHHGWFGSLAPFAGKEEATAHVSPGYPWLLAGLLRVTDLEELPSLVRWLQVGAGILTAGLYFLIGLFVFRSRLVGVLAGILTAVHPFWIVNTTALNDGTFASFLLALSLFLGIAASARGGAVASLLFGLSIAGLALLRAGLLPFCFVAMLWFLWRTRQLERGWLCAILAFLGFANGLAPWVIRNFQVYGEPVPLVSSAYYHVWMGNNPHATGGTLKEQKLLDALAESRQVGPEKLRSDLAAQSQPARYRSLSRDVAAEWQRDPASSLQRRLAATWYFLFSESLALGQGVAEPIPDKEISPPDWYTSVAPTVLTASVLAMIVLALMAWRSAYSWREPARLLTIALIWIPLPYMLSHAEQLHGPRLPLDGVLLTFGAFVLACLWPPTAKVLMAGPEPTSVATK